MIAPAQAKSRAEALAASPRIAIDTKSLSGSIALKGARLDDVSLKDYHETTDPKSPNIILLSPVGSPEPYYVDVAYVAAEGKPMSLPKGDTLWSADSGHLTDRSNKNNIKSNAAGLPFHISNSAMRVP